MLFDPENLKKLYTKLKTPGNYPRTSGMTGKTEAIERCAYCRSYVPVTPVNVGGSGEESGLRAVVTICQACQNDGL